MRAKLVVGACREADDGSVDHPTSQATAIGFEDRRLQTLLDEMGAEPAAYDALEFGLVAMDLDGTVLAYNVAESECAGIRAESVLGLTFFTDVAPCTNNYLVSGRYEEEADLDETIDYVFTLRMRPTPVRLRMLKCTESGRQYLAVRR